MKKHEPWCEVNEAAGFGSIGNTCDCDPLYNKHLAEKWYEEWCISDKERQLLAKYIISQDPTHKDHACSQCVPDGDLVKKGFMCGYHKAIEIVFNNSVKEI